MNDYFERVPAPERDLLKRCDQPEWTAPMLARLTDKRFSDADWIFERKFDGERMLAFRRSGRVDLMTRNKKEINHTYPELVDALAERRGPDFIVDGEIVAFEGALTSFSRLQQRMQIKDADEARASGVAVYCYLFDILYLDDHDITALPLRTRKSILRDAMAFADPVRYSPHRNETGEAFFAEACEKGWEGIIAKRAASRYRHKRSSDWLKFKCANGQELVIGGFTEPRGSREGFGALLVGYFEDDALRYAGKVGTGYDDETLVRLHERLSGMTRKSCPFAEDVDEPAVTWVRPELVGEFGFTEWTGAGKLRHPRFLGLRRDKDPRDVVRETGGA